LTTLSTAQAELTPSQAEPKPPTRARNAAERIIVGAVGTITILMVNVAWLLGCLISQPGRLFVGAVYNIPDFQNYMAWLQQTSRGQYVLHNLFTTMPQNPKQVNLLFIVLGMLVHVTGMAPSVLYQSVRVVAGIGLLVLLWRFIRYCFPTRPDARIASFCFLCFGNGLGWMTAHRWADTNPSNTPIEAWMPEAYTFQSLETSALFCVSTSLIVASMAFLILSENRKQMRFAVFAGICIAILGNIHSYDVLHITAAWTVYLIARTLILRNKEVLQSWLRGIVALVIMLPTTLYVFYTFMVDPVFHARAEVKTLSKPLSWYLSGYAPILALAFVFIVCLLVALILRKRWPETVKVEEPGFPFYSPITATAVVCWAIGGLAVSYVGTPQLSLHTAHPWFPIIWHPLAFQRKMLMGEHIPLCLLAGAGSACIIRYARSWVGWIPVAALIGLSIPAAELFMMRDIRHVFVNSSEAPGYLPFMDKETEDNLDWIRSNTNANDAILGLPTISGIIPAETGRTVWSGHWSETPNFSQTIGMFAEFVNTGTPEYAREAFLTHAKVNYLIIPKEQYLSIALPRLSTTDFSVDTPPYFTEVHENATYIIYRVNTDKLNADSPPNGATP